MEFCPVCGTLLGIRSKILKCSRCGFEKRGLRLVRVALEPKHLGAVSVVLGSGSRLVTKSISHRCPACESSEATLVYCGTTKGDEDPLELYRCNKCGKVSREGWGYC